MHAHPGKKQRKLVSTDARQRAAPNSPEEIVRTYALLQPVCDGLQQRVPDTAAEGVVDLMETIEVDVDHGALHQLDRRAP